MGRAVGALDRIVWIQIIHLILRLVGSVAESSGVEPHITLGGSPVGIGDLDERGNDIDVEALSYSGGNGDRLVEVVICTIEALGYNQGSRLIGNDATGDYGVGLRLNGQRGDGGIASQRRGARVGCVIGYEVCYRSSPWPDVVAASSHCR